MQYDDSISNILLAVVAGVATLVLSWQSWRRSGGRVIWLEALRVVLITMTLFTIFQPEFVNEVVPEDDGVVKVLYDDSGSMDTKDIFVADDRQARRASLDDLKSTDTWAKVQNASVEIESFASGDDTKFTDLNQTLMQIAEEPEGVKAVVLASDGDWNTGDSPSEAARRLRELDIPVFTVGVGREEPLPDVAISRFDLPAFAVVGKPLRIPFSVRSTVAQPVDVPVTIRLPGQEDQLVSVQVPSQGEVESVVSWYPPEIGDHQVSISIPIRSDDAIPENNEQTLPISIRYESLKVLMIDSFPRWEYRYTRNALMRDPGVTVNTLLLQPDIEGRGAGPGYLAEFPSSESLFEYDVVFLGDVGLDNEQLTGEQCEQLRQLVQNHAGGLVLLPGFRGFQASLVNSPLEELSPVEINPDFLKGTRAPQPGFFQLTEAGRTSLLTRFETDAEVNADVWKALPGFFWHAAALRAKPGTTTLAVHHAASNRFGRVPLIATRSFGSGKVLFVGSDGAWRWRKGVEDKYHYRFWSQMVRWMAYQRTMSEGNSLRLVFSPDRPRSGDTITLLVNAMADSGEPLQQGTVRTQIHTSSGNTVSVNLNRDSEEAWGLFRGSFVADEGGKYRLVTHCDDTGATLESELYVTGVPLEVVGRPARLDVLREIAAMTRGRMAGPDELPEIVSAVENLPRSEPVITRWQLWSHPLWGSVLVLLLGVFWSGRKLAGLV